MFTGTVNKAAPDESAIITKWKRTFQEVVEDRDRNKGILVKRLIATAGLKKGVLKKNKNLGLPSGIKK